MSSPLQRPLSVLRRHVRPPCRALSTCAIVLPALTSLWLASATVLAGPPDATLDSILALLAQRKHGHVLYEEQIESPLFKRPLHTSGELFFDAPDRLEKKTLKPTVEDVLVEGDVVTIVRGRHRSSMRLSDYPQLSPLLNGMRATLAGDRSTLEKTFQLTVNAKGAVWELTLQPLPSEKKPAYKSIQIRGVDAIVREMTLERVTGERTTMTLSDPAES